jgi:peptide/nickel transport system permease protein
MAFVRQRLIQLVIVLFAVTILTFTLLRLLPGDPAIAIVGIGASPEKLAETRQKWGLDDPVPVQYVKWQDGAW